MKKTIKRIFMLLPLVVFLTAFIVGGKAHAIPTVIVTDGITTLTAEDLDSDGIVYVTGSINVFNVILTVGTTRPALGSASIPMLDLLSYQLSSSGPGTLSMGFSETGFMTSSPTGVLTSIGGTTDGTVELSSFADVTNDLFGQDTPLSVLGPYNPVSPLVAFSGYDFAGFTHLGTYSLTMIAKVTHESAGLTTFDADVRVPEPSTLLLLGSSLLGLGILGRRMKKA